MIYQIIIPNEVSVQFERLADKKDIPIEMLLSDFLCMGAKMIFDLTEKTDF